jgi:hypothetical protein
VEKEEPPKKKLSSDKYLDMDPNDYGESYTTKIGCDDPKDLPPKKTRKQLLEESVDYEKLSPFVKARIPFPQRLINKDKENQFSQFLDVFRSLTINLPFAKAFEQRPLYAKFMKNLLANKRMMKWSL